jgi:hypothetical protein
MRWLALTVLAAAVPACEHVETLKQGAQSTYTRELRDLGEDIRRKELARVADRAGSVETPEEPVHQANHWHAPSLAGAVTIGPPLPAEPPFLP